MNFQVGNVTRITGQTIPIEKGLKRLFAKRSPDGKAWEISPSSTDQFLKLCEEHNVSAVEVNDGGEPAQPATMLDLYQDQS